MTNNTAYGTNTNSIHTCRCRLATKSPNRDAVAEVDDDLKAHALVLWAITADSEQTWDDVSSDGGRFRSVL